MKNGKLFINGLEVEKWDNVEGGYTDEDLCLEIPEHVLINKKNSFNWSADIDSEDAAKIEELTRLDPDQFIDKKVKLTFQILGPAQRKR